MQKRAAAVLQGGFKEIIWALKGDSMFFSLHAAPTNLSACNGMQDSDKWLLFQYMGSSR